MTRIEASLQTKDSHLFEKFLETKKAVEQLLQTYQLNFPTYTDHSLGHTMEVLRLAGNILSDEELLVLTGDELYVLAMSCILHDVGMCVPESKLESLGYKENYEKYVKANTGSSYEEYLRNLHHEISADFIRREIDQLKIEDSGGSGRFAEAIARVAKGHRKVDLQNIDEYKPRYSVRSGSRDFVCLPYLSAVLRIADELDITNMRTTDLFVKYYKPETGISKEEFEKHLSTTHIDIDNDKVIISANPENEILYNAIKKQLDKIKNVIDYCQKVIRHISNTDGKLYKLQLDKLQPDIKPVGFVPKDIKFTLDVPKIFKTFIGEHLYDTPYVAIREIIQNSIDSCRYKKQLDPLFNPRIIVELKEGKLIVQDNGNGMDEFTVANYFAKLGNSYYEQSQVKDKYEAIGQFGVGVFSYYLISETVEVETKRINGEGIHFEATKNPDDYFHFRNLYKGPTEGTRITLHLNSAQSELLNETVLEQIVRNYFRYIEFPIELILSSGTVACNRNEMAISVEEYIQPYIQYRYLNKFAEVVSESATIDNEEFEGAIGVFIVPTGINKFVSAVNFCGANDEYKTEGLQLSQKGIFVNESKLPGTLYNPRTSVFYKINLKKAVPIKLNRNEVEESDRLKSYISLLTEKLFFQLYGKYTFENDIEKCELMNSILTILSAHQNLFTDKVTDFIKQEAVVKCYSNKEVKYLAIDDFISANREFCYIIISIDYSEEKMDYISSNYTYIDHDESSSVLVDLIEDAGFNYGIVSTKDFTFPFRSQTIKKSETIFKSIHLYDVFCENQKLFNVSSTDEYDIFHNMNHPFSEYVLKNYKTMDKTLENLIHSIYRSTNGAFGARIDLSQLNLLLCDFNSRVGTSFELTKFDFPEYYEFLE